MKIRQLDLLAFGPFTDVSLKFDNDQPGLHIVWGPNEAGKSSSLRALSQFLFGIPHVSIDTFLHSNQNLRIGVRLESAAGELLECVRRKGRTNMLRGPDDVEVIDPARLAHMLGGIDEQTFRHRFGIDYAELRQGGEAVVKGGGDLGEILFAAGAGVTGILQVQQRLAGEADELFKLRGSNQRINQALSELKQTRDKIKESQLLTSEWVKHDKASREAQARKAFIDEQLLALKSGKSRLERIDAALPLIAQRQLLGEQLVEVAGATLLPDDFPGRRHESVTHQNAERRVQSDAEAELARLRKLIEEQQMPSGLLAHRTAITNLHTQLGSFLKAAKDRLTLIARLEQAEKQEKTIRRELDSELKPAEVERMRITRTQRRKIQSLGGDFKAILENRVKADRSLGELRDEISEIESKLSENESPIDSSELGRAVHRARKEGDLEHQLDEEQKLLGQLAHQAKIDLKKLWGWEGTLDELERLPVPAIETVERFENELTSAQTEVNSIQQRFDDARGQIQQLDQKLEKLRLEHDVPTEDDLSTSRQQREVGWQLVLRAWREEIGENDVETAGFIAHFASGGDLAQAFQASVDSADQIGDRLRREADRVAEKAKLTVDRNDLLLRSDEYREQLTYLRKEHRRLQECWCDDWSPLKIDPLSPREMHSWLDRQARLVNAAENSRLKRNRVESLDGLIQSHRAELNHCLAKLGHLASDRDETLNAMLERCEHIIEEIGLAARSHQDLKTNLKILQNKLPTTVQRAEQAVKSLDQWRIDWASAVDPLGLDGHADPSTVNSVIDTMDELLAHIETVNELQKRIDGIDRDAREYTESVERLLSHGARDLLEAPINQAVGDLYDRLGAANIAQTRLEGWNEQLQQEETKHAKAKSQVLDCQNTIEAMCQDAGCATPDELFEAEARSNKRRKLENELSGLEKQLAGLSGGAELDDFIAEAMQKDADQVKAAIDDLSDKINLLEQEKVEVSEAIGAERIEMRRMNGGQEAAAAQERVEQLLACIRNDAEHYIRLRIAASVLRRSIERFREASKGPVLQRASELFRELTLNSFAGLRADYDDNGNAVLVGVRPDGQHIVGVDGMSDGTCDQLYLALRLSLLESFVAQHAPIPFIVDDILIMFDDARAVAALKALVRLAEHTQVIFFTHHEHVIRLARENLGNKLFTHLLDHRTTTC